MRSGHSRKLTSFFAPTTRKLSLQIVKTPVLPHPTQGCTARTAQVYRLETCLCMYKNTMITFAHWQFQFGNCLEINSIFKQVF